MFLKIHATDDTLHTVTQVFGEVLTVAFDLQREFARGCQHERTRCTLWPLGCVWLFPQSGEDRNEKSCGFTCASLRLSGDVVVRQAKWQRFALNGCAVLEVEVGDGVHQRQRQFEIVKTNLVWKNWHGEVG